MSPSCSPTPCIFRVGSTFSSGECTPELTNNKTLCAAKTHEHPAGTRQSKPCYSALDDMADLIISVCSKKKSDRLGAKITSCAKSYTK